jgi:hypothetical protein
MGVLESGRENTAGWPELGSHIRLPTTMKGVDVHGGGLGIDAAVVHNYQLAYVPGLLQTEDYIRTLFRQSWRHHTDAEIDWEVRQRLLRQRRLTKQPALELVAIVDESVLHRPVGN